MSSAAAAACSIIGVNNKPSQKVKENRALLFQLDSQTVKIDSLHEVARTTVKIYTIVFMLHEIRVSPPPNTQYYYQSSLLAGLMLCTKASTQPRDF